MFDVLSERWAWRTVTALAFTAGGVDAVGLSALGRFVSHMSGTTSTLAGALTSRAEELAFLCTAVLCAFTSGAIVTGFVIASGRLHDARRVTSFLLVFETGLLLAAAGALCRPAAGPEDLPRIATAAVLLAGAMGCQNRTGVFVAGGKARTTHVTGTLTDLGYHLGRLIQRGPLARSTRGRRRSRPPPSGSIRGLPRRWAHGPSHLPRPGRLVFPGLRRRTRHALRPCTRQTNLGLRLAMRRLHVDLERGRRRVRLPTKSERVIASFRPSDHPHSLEVSPLRSWSPMCLKLSPQRRRFSCSVSRTPRRRP